MSIGRVTQTMMSQHALIGLQAGLRRVSDVQEQLSTGRVINRPSDDPIGSAAASYVVRPVFGGITAQPTAYAADGTFTGVAGAVTRTVADGVQVRVDVNGPAAFGPDGDSVFTHLTALSAALRAGNTTAISAAIDDLGADADRINAVHADAGTRAGRVERAKTAAEDAHLSLTSALSEVENTDLPKATVELQLQQVAYQAALAATARVIQPSLQDFLR